MAGDQDLGSTVKALREQSRMSQEAVAALYTEAAGHKRTQSWISAVERGALKVAPDDLRHLARALGTSYNTLAVAAGYAEEQDATREPTIDERIAADLLAFAQTRPDLLATLRRLKLVDDPAAYEQAMRVIHRFLISSIETALDDGGEGE